MLKHEDWPGLEKISRAARLPGGGLDAADLDPVRQWRAVPRFRDGARRRRRDDRLRLSRHAGRRRQAFARGRARRGRTTCSTPICRCCATSSSRASASRCANTCCRSAAPSPPTRSARPRRRCRRKPRRRSIFCWSGWRGSTSGRRCRRRSCCRNSPPTACASPISTSLPEGADLGEPILLIHGFASSHRINWVNPRWVDTLTRSRPARDRVRQSRPRAKREALRSRRLSFGRRWRATPPICSIISASPAPT